VYVLHEYMMNEKRDEYFAKTLDIVIDKNIDPVLFLSLGYANIRANLADVRERGRWVEKLKKLQVRLHEDRRRSFLSSGKYSEEKMSTMMPTSKITTCQTKEQNNRNLCERPNAPKVSPPTSPAKPATDADDRAAAAEAEKAADELLRLEDDRMAKQAARKARKKQGRQQPQPPPVPATTATPPTETAAATEEGAKAEAQEESARVVDTYGIVALNKFGGLMEPDAAAPEATAVDQTVAAAQPDRPSAEFMQIVEAFAAAQELTSQPKPTLGAATEEGDVGKPRDDDEVTHVDDSKTSESDAAVSDDGACHTQPASPAVATARWIVHNTFIDVEAVEAEEGKRTRALSLDGHLQRLAAQRPRKA